MVLLLWSQWVAVWWLLVPCWDSGGWRLCGGDVLLSVCG
jgi:hypothetical protein